MKKIGVISDTHGYMDERILHHLKKCNLIIHAGDVGNKSVADQLSKISGFKCVYGNIDGTEIRSAYPEFEIIHIEGITILLIHIAGAIRKYNAQVRALIHEHHPEILICGHSHLLKVQKDPAFNLLYINPGAAGISGFHKVRTLLRFDVADGRVNNLEVIELGLRSAKAIN